jgi:hypothetical protein
MFKRSLLATTAILACTFFASQAQAVIQTIQWNFAVVFTNTSSRSFDSTGLPLVPGWTAANDNVILSGGSTTSPVNVTTGVASSQIQGNGTGVGVVANGAPTTIDQSAGGTSFDFVRIDLTAPLAFITANSLTGTWAIDLSGLGASETAQIFTNVVATSATTPLLITGANVFTDLPGTVQQYLFVRQNANKTSSFQLSGLRFTYDDGCPVGGCVATPEPGALGLLGLSLLGFGLLRKKQ